MRRFAIGLSLAAIGLAAAACVFFSDGAANPEEPVSDIHQTDTFAVGAAPRLIVANNHGLIAIDGGAAGVISVDARLRRPEGLDYQVEQNGDTVSVRAHSHGLRWWWPPSWFRASRANIRVTVPEQTEVQVSGANGALSARNLAGNGSLNTSNGKIDARELSGRFRLVTSNGAIEAQQVSGNITALTSNGRIAITDANGAFNLETSNGAIRFRGELAAQSHNRFKTSNGSITAALAGDPPNVRVDARTSNGSVEVAYPIAVTGMATQSHLTGDIGDGSAGLTLETSNGSISIE